MRTARILVPPGIGDGYWVLVKLRGFMSRLKIERAQVFVQDAGPRRAHGMWERVPFVEFGGYAAVPRVGFRADKAALRRAYRTPSFAVQARVCGFDYLLSFNGALDHGRSLDQAMAGEARWYEPITDEAVTAAHADRFRARFGRYVVAAFWGHGFYRNWLAEFGEQQIVDTLRLLADSGRTVVVTGAAWDAGMIQDRLAAADPRFVGLVGATDYDELTGLLAGTDAVVGFPAGSSLLGPYFRRPTVLLWHEHFPRAFWRNAVPPDASLYRALHTATATPETVAGVVQELIALTARAA